MKFQDMTVSDFAEALASKAPVPGGGGVSALVGALGASLASMVGNLTSGKKKYAQYEGKIQSILTKAEELRVLLLALADADAEAFEPLSRAYSIPKDAPDRAAVMDAALRTAAQPPLDIMAACCEVIKLHERLLVCGSAIAMSDVGVGAALCSAALRGASYNVFINARSLSDRQEGASLSAAAQTMLDEYLPRAEEVMRGVEARIKG